MGDTKSGVIISRSINIEIHDTSKANLPEVSDFTINEVRGYINEAIKSNNIDDLKRAQQISQYNELRWNRQVVNHENSLKNELAKTGRRKSQKRIDSLRNRINYYKKGLNSIAAETRTINSYLRKARNRLS